MKFAVAALFGLASATESWYGRGVGYTTRPHDTTYKTRRATWSPTTTVTSGQAFARYGERPAVVRCEAKGTGLPTECSWKQARAELAKECRGAGCVKSCYGSTCGVSGYGGRTGIRGTAPVKTRTVAGYAGWEHPSMRLLRSLGKEPEVGGKAWGYAELTKVPCGKGYVCGYGCLDACEEPEEVTIEKTTPRTIKMWDLPSRTANTRLTNGLLGAKLGLKNPGNPVIPGAAPIPVPTRKVRVQKKRPYMEDGQPNHVVDTKCDTCGTGSCGPCRTSGEPDDFTPSYNVGRYHSKKSTNYLW